MNTFRICYQANLLGPTKITFLDAEDENQAQEGWYESRWIRDNGD